MDEDTWIHRTEDRWLCNKIKFFPFFFFFGPPAVGGRVKWVCPSIVLSERFLGIV